MNIPDKIKISIEKRLVDIQLERFSQDTIKLFLIEMREYLHKNFALREIAHFIAHPERDRGEILETVNYSYNRSKVLFRQLDGNKSGKGLELDIDNLPIDVYDTVVWHHSKIKPNVSKLGKFNKAFSFNQDKQLYGAKKHISKKIVKTIKEAIGILSLQPALTQSEIIDEIVLSLRNMDFDSYSSAIIKAQNDIIICILSMLHQSAFKLKDGNIAEAHISNDPIVDDLSGKVYLSATVKPNLSKPAIGFTLISTDVTIKESFSNSMVNLEFGFPRVDYKNEDHIEAVRNNEGKMLFIKQIKLPNE